MGARQDPHQRRLAGAVAADEADDLARHRGRCVTSRTACTPPNATLMFRISTSGVRSATVTGRSSSPLTSRAGG